MFRGLRFVAVALAVLFVAEPALAQFLPDLRITLGQRKRQVPDLIQPEFVQQLLITPSQAAAIAQAQVPGSMVVKVKRRGDVFVVTLRTADSVVKVLVSGTDGSVL